VGRRSLKSNQSVPAIFCGMRTFGLILLCALAAYWVDAHFYGGLYSNSVLTVARHVGHGILMGLTGRG
jgi:hypothetical protein